MSRDAESPASLLIVDDEPAVTTMLDRVCTNAGYVVETAGTGGRGERLALSRDFDLITLELELPDRSGIEVLRTIRQSGTLTPVLLLTGRSDEAAIVEGFEAGADDYVQKPFSLPELLARVRALLRRRHPTSQGQLSCGNLTLNRASREVRVAGGTVDLPPREYGLLEALLRVPGRVVSRETLLRNVWDIDFDPGTNRVEVTVSRLRGMLRKAGAETRITAVRGAGYRVTSSQLN
jgi:DNA-binding response OmpR family regulator